MAEIPLEVILTWPKPNPDNPETRDKGFLVAGVILGVAGVAAVSLRLWARFVTMRKPGADDFFILAALLFSVGFTINFNFGLYKFGGDRHAWDQDLQVLPKYFVTLWTGTQLYLLGQACVKISILLLYRTILRRTTDKTNQYINWALLAFVVMYSTACYLVVVFQCTPVDWAWRPARYIDEDSAPCLGQGVTFQIPSYFSTVSDFLVACFPLLFLRHLQLPARRKWLLIVVFALGFVICAAGIMRIVTLHHWMYDSYDKTWTGYWHQIWAQLELWLGVICACVPILQKQFTAEGIYGRKLSVTVAMIRSRKASADSEADKAHFSPTDSKATGTTEASEAMTLKSLTESEMQYLGDYDRSMIIGSAV